MTKVVRDFCFCDGEVDYIYKINIIFCLQTIVSIVYQNHSLFHGLE